MRTRITHFVRRCVSGVLQLFLLMKPLIPTVPAAAFAVCSLACAIAPAQAGESARKSYDIAAGDAVSTLKSFADESGRQVLFLVDAVRGVTTNPVRGEYTVREALTRLVADTGLVVAEDAKSGALMVNRLAARESPPSQPKPKTQAIPMKTRSLFTALSSWLALGTPAIVPASAQPAADATKLAPFEVKSDRDYGYRATNSMTATRSAAAIIDTPVNIAVITEDFFKDIGANFLNDGLKYVSSVSTTTLGNNGRIGGSGDGTKIRGFDIPFALRNGFRRNRNVSIRNIERVEVAKGPVSMLFGQTAPGGLINYITKKPKFTDGGSATLRFGDYSLWSGEIEAETAFDAFAAPGKDIAVRAMYATSDQDLYRDYEFRKELFGLGQIALRPLPGLNILLEIEHLNTRSNLAQGLPWGSNKWSADTAAALAAGRQADVNRWYADRGQWQNDIQVRTGTRPSSVDSFMDKAYPDGKFWTYNLTGPDARFNARSNNVSGDMDWKVNNHVTFRYGFNQYRVHYFEKFLFTDTPNSDYTLAAAGLSSRNNDQVITSHQFDTLFRWDLPGVKNTINAGGEFINDYETSRRLAYDLALIAQGSGVSLARPPAGQNDFGPAVNGLFYYNTRVQPVILIDKGITTFDRPANKSITDQDRRGFYVTWRAELLQGRLNLNAGIRGERGETSVFAPVSRVRSTDVQQGNTPMFGANYRLLPGLVAFAGYSESFVPSAARTATGPLARADEILPLGALQGKGREIGFKTDWRNHTLTGTISWFRAELSNLPELDSVRTNADPRNKDPNTPSGIRFPFDVFFYRGGGVQATEGIDGDLVWSPARNFQVLGSFTYAWKAEVEKGLATSPGSGNPLTGPAVAIPLISPNGTRLVRMPKETLALFGKYSFATGDLKGVSVGFGGRHIGEHIIFFGGVDFQNFTQKAYTVFDASLGYETKVFGRQTHFSLNGSNLADKRYVDGTYTPGVPRRVQLTARVQF